MQEGNASLEDILASIKSMMARDDAERRVSNAGQEAAGEPSHVSNIAAEPVDAEEAADLHALADTEGVEMPSPSQEFAARPVEALTRPATIAAIRQSLAALEWLGHAQGPAPHPASIDTLTRAMLRPMVAEWLDANLPALVERMVQEEIARVMRPEN